MATPAGSRRNEPLQKGGRGGAGGASRKNLLLVEDDSEAVPEAQFAHELKGGDATADTAWTGVLANAEDAVVACVLAALSEAEDAREKDARHATMVQGAWRGHAVRLDIRRQNAAALTIQRVWRGWKGRVRFAELWRQEAARRRKEYFDQQATVVQRHFRGWQARKAATPAVEGGLPGAGNFYARKRYLERIREQNEERAKRSAAVEEQNELERREREAAAAEKLKEHSSNFHHLVGTGSIPGVLSGDTEVEEYVRTAAVETMLTGVDSKSGTARFRNTGAHLHSTPPTASPPRRGSLNHTMGTSQRGQVAEIAAARKFASDLEAIPEPDSPNWNPTSTTQEAVWDNVTKHTFATHVAPPKDQGSQLLSRGSGHGTLTSTYQRLSEDKPAQAPSRSAGVPKVFQQKQMVGRRRLNPHHPTSHVVEDTPTSPS